MRKVILALGTSLDLHIARPNGAVDFLYMPKDLYPVQAAFFRRIDTAILGRKTYEDALAMGGNFSEWKLTYYLMTRSPLANPVPEVTVTSATPAQVVSRIRRKPGKHIWLMGGGELARSFLAADLVDELSFAVVPKLLGAGRPLFPQGFPEREFSLLRNESYGKGVIALTYARKRPRKKSR
ncbi:MAG: dihydrofolate reductase [Acidobacteriales bacterium]|nr:dihydrofolate reductase [Terriglobales bacterium]